MKKYYFISGLPRSGSTLLSAVLKQNPRFTASISDPLHGYVKAITQITSQAVGMQAQVSVEKRRKLMLGLFDNYYSTDTEVCFNTNRGWTADTALLRDLFPDFHMIVCVRDIPWILDSFEVLNNKNPHTIKPLYHHQDLANVYDRSHMLMGGNPNYPGYVAGPLANVKHSAFCSERNNLLFVDYDALVLYPDAVLRKIYEFLGEPWFQHDYNNVEDNYDEFDSDAKITGLHTVRKKIEYKQRRSILPDELWTQYMPMTFWKQDSFKPIMAELNWISVGNQQKATATAQPINNSLKINRQL
jgi:sulfotransferase